MAANMNWTDNTQPWLPPSDETSPPIPHGDIPKIELAVWVIIGLASSLVALRIYYHIFRGRRYLWSDDYFLIAALLCLVGNSIAIQEWVPYGFEPSVTSTVSKGMVLTGSLMGLFNSLALAFSKTSLGITFIRLTTGWWKSGLGISVFVIDILFAVQAWSYWVPDCANQSEPFRVQSSDQGCVTFEGIKSLRLTVQILSCALDVYFTIMPWKIVRSLELKRFEKIGLGIAMSFGFASLASGLVRMVALVRLTNDFYDHQPFYAVAGFLFNYLEPGFSIVAACIPVLRKIFMEIIQWKKNTPTFGWIPSRRKQPALPAVLPLSESLEGSAFGGKSSSDKTDTTLLRPTTHMVQTTPTSPTTVAVLEEKNVHPTPSETMC